MIRVICIIMRPFGCWENVGKQLKLGNLLNYSMSRNGLLHDSGFPFLFPMIHWQANRPCSQIILEGYPPSVHLCFEQALVASQSSILAQYTSERKATSKGSYGSGKHIDVIAT